MEGHASQQSNQHIDHPLHYVPYYINEAQKQLNARDTAVRELQHELAQKEKQHLAEKSGFERQLLSMQMHLGAARQQAIATEQTCAEQDPHTSEPKNSFGRADTARPAPDGHVAGPRYPDLEAALHSLREERQCLVQQHQAEQDEWSAALAHLSHRCDALQSALKSLGYELDASGELTKCAKRNTRKRKAVKREE